MICVEKGSAMWSFIPRISCQRTAITFKHFADQFKNWSAKWVCSPQENTRDCKISGKVTYRKLLFSVKLFATFCHLHHHELLLGCTLHLSAPLERGSTVNRHKSVKVYTIEGLKDVSASRNIFPRGKSPGGRRNGIHILDFAATYPNGVTISPVLATGRPQCRSHEGHMKKLMHMRHHNLTACVQGFGN